MCKDICKQIPVLKLYCLPAIAPNRVFKRNKPAITNILTVTAGRSNAWMAPPLSPAYQNPYMREGRDSGYYVPYLFKRIGEYGGGPGCASLRQLAI